MGVIVPVKKTNQNRTRLGLVDNVTATVTPSGLFQIERGFGKFQIVTATRRCIIVRTFGGEVGVAVEVGEIIKSTRPWLP